MKTMITILLAATLAAAQTATATKPVTHKPAAHKFVHHHVVAHKAVPARPAGPPVATIDTSAGKLTCTLFPDKAPKTVANFIGLATGTKDWTDPKTNQLVHGKPLYDGTIFHRVIPGFVIQGGDPLGTGEGGPGYKFDDELSADLTYDKPGRLAMANSGPNTNGSQFFITTDPLPQLNPCLDAGGCDRGMRHMGPNTGYTIFGQCDDASVALAKQIAAAPRNSQDLPNNPVTIKHISISGIEPPKKAPVRKKPSAATHRKIHPKHATPQQ